MLVVSAGIAFYAQRSLGVDPVVARLAPWVFLAFALGFAVYRLALVAAGRYSPFKALTTGHRPIYDTIAALIAHGLFGRFPNLRVATIESGSDWVGELVPKMTKSFKQMPGAWGEDPVETLRRHVWVSPYYEDDIRELADILGSDHVLMGSDWPHAEGIAEPAAFVSDLGGFSDDEVRKVMRENGLALSIPRPA